MGREGVTLDPVTLGWGLQGGLPRRLKGDSSLIMSSPVLQRQVPLAIQRAIGSDRRALGSLGSIAGVQMHWMQMLLKRWGGLLE